MKTVFGILLLILITIILVACGQEGSVPQTENTSTWQEQYNLGVRYLSEGNFEEAIIAFVAAIEIDPKQAPAYTGRGDAYSGVATLTEDAEEELEWLQRAVEDYQTALELGDGSVKGKLQAIRSMLEQLQNEECEQPQRFADIETLDNTVQAIFLELKKEILDGNSDKVYQVLLKDFIEPVENGTIPEEEFARGEICTRIDDCKASLRYNEDRDTAQLIGTIELREEKGKAYLYQAMEVNGELISAQIVGESSSWNWNGYYEKYSNYFRDEGKYAYYSEKGSCVNGLLNGEIYTAYPNGEFVDICENGKITSREVTESSHVLTVDGGYDIDYYKSLMLWDN